MAEDDSDLAMIQESLHLTTDYQLRAPRPTEHPSSPPKGFFTPNSIRVICSMIILCWVYKISLTAQLFHHFYSLKRSELGVFMVQSRPTNWRSTHPSSFELYDHTHHPTSHTASEKIQGVQLLLFVILQEGFLHFFGLSPAPAEIGAPFEAAMFRAYSKGFARMPSDLLKAVGEEVEKGLTTPSATSSHEIASAGEHSESSTPLLLPAGPSEAIPAALEPVEEERAPSPPLDKRLRLKRKHKRVAPAASSSPLPPLGQTSKAQQDQDQATIKSLQAYLHKAQTEASTLKQEKALALASTEKVKVELVEYRSGEGDRLEAYRISYIKSPLFQKKIGPSIRPTPRPPSGLDDIPSASPSFQAASRASWQAHLATEPTRTATPPARRSCSPPGDSNSDDQPLRFRRRCIQLEPDLDAGGAGRPSAGGVSHPSAGGAAGDTSHPFADPVPRSPILPAPTPSPTTAADPPATCAQEQAAPPSSEPVHTPFQVSGDTAGPSATPLPDESRPGPSHPAAFPPTASAPQLQGLSYR
ncbi:sal-like protein 3 [Zingiber officinale]|uniref:sal-like protein 3 n=1 Tax=Zingiber officinale TaxID=94328 RepID=UPI001C4AD740|nr:sal-like protein 3 [Zingiber officinale]